MACLLAAGSSAASDCDEGPLSAAGASSDIPMIGLVAGGASVTMSVACHFTSGSGSYTVTSDPDRPDIVAANMSDDDLTLDPGFVGNKASETVTVTITRGTESMTITVAVSSCVTTSGETFRPLVIYVNGTLMRRIANYFRHSEGTALAYEASSSNTDTFTVLLSSGWMTLTAVGEGTAQLIMTARNACGAARDTVAVTVKEKSPPRANPDNPIPDTTMTLSDDPIFIHLPPHFIEEDGDVITYSASHSGGNIVAALITGVNRDSLELQLRNTGNTGDVRVSATAKDLEGWAFQRFTVTVNTDGTNQAPVVKKAIGDFGRRSAGPDSTLNLLDYFEDADSDVLKYTVTSSAEGTATADTSGNTLTLTPGSVTRTSRATITVVARDPAGLKATDDFVVIVDPAMRDTTLASGSYTAKTMLSDYFTDPQDAALTLAAASSAPDTATAAIADGVLTVTSQAVTETGTATITVRATGSASAEDAFVVTVNPNVSPVVDNVMRDTTLASGGSTATYTLADHFTDPDGKDADLRYDPLVSSAPNTATAAIADGVLTVTTKTVTTKTVTTPGTATITVTARDPGGLTAPDDFVVTVTTGCAITVNPPLDDLSLPSGGYMATYTLSDHFRASNCTDDVRYSARSDNGAIATASISSGVLMVTSVGTGTTDITVTATSGTVSASAEFEVEVTQNIAPRVKSAIGNTSLAVGGATKTYTLSDHFEDPDFDDAYLTYTASSNDDAKATASVSGGVLTVTSSSTTTGTTTITVTATDKGNLSVSDDFVVTVVTVTNLPPKVVKDIGHQTFMTDGAARTIDLSRHFSDPEGQPLTYSETVGPGQTTNAVDAEISGSTLTLTPGAAAGTATVMVTATDPPGASTRHNFPVTVTAPPPDNGAPTCDDDEEKLTLGGGSKDLNMDNLCEDPDNDDLTYTLVRVAPNTAASASLSGSTLTITPSSVGSVTLTVTAEDDDEATAQSSIQVTVHEEPECDDIVVTLTRNDDDEVLDLDDYCSDPDGDDLGYELTPVPSDAAASISLSSGNLTISPEAVGSVTATVTATDDDGAATTATVSVTVNNEHPETVDSIADVTIGIEDAAREFGVASYFTDPESDPLTYDADSDTPGSVTAEITGSSNNMVTLTPVAPGTATVSVTAEDSYGDVSLAQTFTVTIVNGRPTVVGTIADVTLQLGGSPEEFDVSSYFSDPEGHDLEYDAASSNEGVVSTSISGSTLELTPEAGGSVTVSVTAEDEYEAVSPAQTFTALVNRSPTVTDEIDDVALLLTESEEIDLSQHFSDPDGDNLSYSTSNSGAFVDRDVSGSTLTLSAEAVGSAEVTVTASDGNGGSAETDFTVTIRGTPVAQGIMPDRTLRVNGPSVSFDVVSYFSEPDGEDLEYSVSLDYPAEARIPDIVSASMSGSTLTLQPLTTPEKITVIVTARDSDGSTSQSFVLTVSGGF